MNLLRGTFARATPYLERLDAMLSSPGAVTDDPSLQGEWLAIQSKLLLVQGRPAESRDLGNRALQILPEAEVNVRSMIHVNLAMAYQQMLDYDHAAETFQSIVRDARATGNFVSETLGISGRVQMMLLQGRLHLAFEIAAEGIDRLEASERVTPFAATLYGEIGQIRYYWHQLDEAQKYLLRSIQTSGRSGYSDPEIYQHVMLSRMFQMDGNWDASTQEIQKACDLSRIIPPAMVREEVISQQVRVYLATGRLEAALTVLKGEGFSFDGEFRYPDLLPDSGAPVRPVTHPVGLLYNSALRVLLFQARMKHNLENLKRGIELASIVLAGELQCRHIPIALETLLLRGQMYETLGNERKSLADVAKALELAEPEGFISVFVEEGTPTARALETMLDRDLLGAVQPGYVQDILSTFPKTQISAKRGGRQPASNLRASADAVEAGDPLAPVEALTNRELEVLQLIAAGDSNRAIAEKLVITVSAVKKHSANIYGKLYVSSRTQAVARARQLRLLPNIE
jgi:LuxR family maltose regulon positive regulatory protein